MQPSLWVPQSESGPCIVLLREHPAYEPRAGRVLGCAAALGLLARVWAGLEWLGALVGLHRLSHTRAVPASLVPDLTDVLMSCPESWQSPTPSFKY